MDAGYVAALSGLIGAAIGSASSIATMIIQARRTEGIGRSRLLKCLLPNSRCAWILWLASAGGDLPAQRFVHHNDRS